MATKTKKSQSVNKKVKEEPKKPKLEIKEIKSSAIIFEIPSRRSALPDLEREAVSEDNQFHPSAKNSEASFSASLTPVESAQSVANLEEFASQQPTSEEPKITQVQYDSRYEQTLYDINANAKRQREQDKDILVSASPLKQELPTPSRIHEQDFGNMVLEKMQRESPRTDDDLDYVAKAERFKREESELPFQRKYNEKRR